MIKGSLYLIEEAVPYETRPNARDNIIAIAPRIPCAAPASYRFRAEAIEHSIRHNKIGRIIFLEYYDDLFIWDLALYSLLGVTVVDAEGNDLRNVLHSAQSLKSALQKGAAGKQDSNLADKDFLREHLGRDYALSSYRYQAQTQEQRQAARSHSCLSNSKLTKSLRSIKRLILRVWETGNGGK
jgi:hypothetical protein